MTPYPIIPQKKRGRPLRYQTQADRLEAKRIQARVRYARQRCVHVRSGRYDSGSFGYFGCSREGDSLTSSTHAPHLVKGDVDAAEQWNDEDMGMDDKDEEGEQDRGDGDWSRRDEAHRDEPPFDTLHTDAISPQPRHQRFNARRSYVSAPEDRPFRTYRAATPDIQGEAEGSLVDDQDSGSSAGSSSEDEPADLESVVDRIKRLEEKVKEERKIRETLERYIESDDAPNAQAARRRIKELVATVQTERKLRELTEKYWVVAMENMGLRLEIQRLRLGHPEEAELAT